MKAGPHMSDFDAEAVAERLKSESRMRRKPRTYAQRRSVLDKFTSELLKLDTAGCNAIQLQHWLVERNITVNTSTIYRWLYRNRESR
jgi:IS30 family transposase